MVGVSRTGCRRAPPLDADADADEEEEEAEAVIDAVAADALLDAAAAEEEEEAEGPSSIAESG